MSAVQPFIGIDFGTSKSTMAWFNTDSGQAEVLRNAEGRDETPSVVYFGRGERLVGDPAEMMLEDPETRRMVVRSVKRDLVNQPSLALPSGRIKALDVASTILAKLRKDAEELHFHQAVQRAVITYPAAFDEMQLEKIQEAAQQAGFTETVMVPEPVAAALAYTQSGLALGKHVLVYDLGGGTFDLALLTRDPHGSFSVALPPKGLARCGGDDFDRAIYDHCDEVAATTLGRGINETGETDLLFLRQCRVRKETLSAAERCGFSSYLSGGDRPVRFSYELTREQFELLIGPTVEATVRLTGSLIQEATTAGYPVETVVLIGGSSRIPLAQRRLAQSLPVAPEKWHKQDVAVALGAALHGKLLWHAGSSQISSAGVRTGGGARPSRDPALPPGPSTGASPDSHSSNTDPAPIAGPAKQPAAGASGQSPVPARPGQLPAGSAAPQPPPTTATSMPAARATTPGSDPARPPLAASGPGRAQIYPQAPGQQAHPPISGPVQPANRPAPTSPSAPPVAGTAPSRAYPAATAQPSSYASQARPHQSAPSDSAGGVPVASGYAPIPQPAPRPATVPHTGTATAAPGRYATAQFGVRLGAYVIDQTITFFAAAFVTYAAMSASTSQTTDNTTTSGSASPAATAAFFGFTVLIQAIYYGYCWSAGGRTVGYRMLGLRLVRADGSPVAVGTALLRYLYYVICAVPLYFGFLWMLWDPAKQTWADKLTGTLVTSDRTVA